MSRPDVEELLRDYLAQAEEEGGWSDGADAHFRSRFERRARPKRSLLPAIVALAAAVLVGVWTLGDGESASPVPVGLAVLDDAGRPIIVARGAESGDAPNSVYLRVSSERSAFGAAWIYLPDGRREHLEVGESREFVLGVGFTEIGPLLVPPTSSEGEYALLFLSSSARIDVEAVEDVLPSERPTGSSGPGDDLSDLANALTAEGVAVSVRTFAF